MAITDAQFWAAVKSIHGKAIERDLFADNSWTRLIKSTKPSNVQFTMRGIPVVNYGVDTLTNKTLVDETFMKSMNGFQNSFYRDFFGMAVPINVNLVEELQCRSTKSD